VSSVGGTRKAVRQPVRRPQDKYTQRRDHDIPQKLCWGTADVQSVPQGGSNTRSLVFTHANSPAPSITPHRQPPPAPTTHHSGCQHEILVLNFLILIQTFPKESSPDQFIAMKEILARSRRAGSQPTNQRVYSKFMLIKYKQEHFVMVFGARCGSVLTQEPVARS
jgi:hypothetical protein